MIYEGRDEVDSDLIKQQYCIPWVREEHMDDVGDQDEWPRHDVGLEQLRFVGVC